MGIVPDEVQLGDEAESYNYDECEKRVNPQIGKAKVASESKENALFSTDKGINWPLVLTVLALYAFEYLILATPYMFFIKEYAIAEYGGYGLLIALYVHICMSHSKAVCPSPRQQNLLSSA